jgi:hypothetical protein
MSISFPRGRGGSCTSARAASVRSHEAYEFDHDHGDRLHEAAKERVAASRVKLDSVVALTSPARAFHGASTRLNIG